MRLFVAIPLPVPIRENLAHWVRKCGAQPTLRWTPAEQLHITLHFLGEVAEERVSGVMKALDKVHAAAFSVALDRVELLGRGSILAAAMQLNPEIAALAESVRARMAEFTDGVAETFREFRPHVTLARARRGKTAPKLKTLPAFPMLEFRAECFRLYRSELRKEGAAHMVVGEWRLGDSLRG
jgi:RNA 2',3'-cyclic 3'-phosphodiesterase